MRYLFNILAPGIAMTACLTALAQTPNFGNVGRTPSEAEIKSWDISVGPAGTELPPGKGTAPEGEKIFAQKCAACHGPSGESGKDGPRLVGPPNGLKLPRPIKSIASFWSYPTTIFDYTRRAMPWKGGEGTLSADEVYAVTAFLLYRNGIIQENAVMDATSLPKVQMPARDSFVPLKPEWKPQEKRPYGHFPNGAR